MTFSITERTFSSKLSLLMTDLIRIKKFPFSQVETEIRDLWGKQPDLVIFDNERRPVCVIEVKRPIVPPYQVEMFQQSFGYASNNGVPFFATFNSNVLVVWKTFEAGIRLIERKFKEYRIASISRLNETETISYKSKLGKFFEEFLNDLSILVLSEDKEAAIERILPSFKIDYVLVRYLQSIIESMYIQVYDNLKVTCEINSNFLDEIIQWYLIQGWDISDREELLETTARQYSLLLINRIIFYNVLCVTYPNFRPEDYAIHGFPEKLEPLSVLKSLSEAEFLNGLENQFSNACKINYEAVFEKSFLHSLPIPTSIIEVLDHLISELMKYDFSTIGYEIIGTIFQTLIPKEDRKKFGQYFTKADIVDLMLAFSIKGDNIRILDPACGAGTFLVRAWSRFKFLNESMTHLQILKLLWGMDISEFPAHLSIINLVIKDLSEGNNFPRIAVGDFFHLKPSTPLQYTKFHHNTITINDRQDLIPTFDVVVANPPYTRQEQIEDKLYEGYKEDIRKLINEESGIQVSKRASIYVHFLLHSAQFLTSKGSMAYITSNAWLDSDYGGALQNYLLQNFIIHAIIGSEVERFFEDPEINTCILIIEKCPDKKKCFENHVKFVRFTKKISDTLPHFSSSLSEVESDDERWSSFDELITYILNQSESNENLDVGITCFLKNQEALYLDGFDTEKGKYKWTPWGRYLRITSSYLELLKSDLVVELKEVAFANRGLRTGNNPFYYFGEGKKEQSQIPDNYFKPLLKSPRLWTKIDASSSAIVSPKTPKYALTIPDDEQLANPHLIAYIKDGIAKRVPEGTLNCNENWYSLNWTGYDAPLLCPEVYDDRFIIFTNKNEEIIDQRFTMITPKSQISAELMIAILNSTASYYALELTGRTQLGGGGLDVPPASMKFVLVLDPLKIPENISKEIIKTYRQFKKSPINNIFKELRTEDVSKFKLADIKKSRYSLDKLLFELMGWEEDRQINLYKELLHLVKQRKAKAESAKKRAAIKKKKEAIDRKAIVSFIAGEVITPKLEKLFSMEYSTDRTVEIPVHKEISRGQDLVGIYVQFDRKKIYCENKAETVFLNYYALMGVNEVTIPKDQKILTSYLKVFGKLGKSISEYTEGFIRVSTLNSKKARKLRERMIFDVWREISTILRG